MNLLAIDDSDDTLNAISDYCAFHNIVCEVTSQGLRGLFMIQKKEYDLILLDVAMPGYTGFDILDQLKKQGVYDKNIVVITAARLILKDFTDYIDVGVREILHKPVELDHLNKVIKKYDNSVRNVSPTPLVNNNLNSC